MNWISVENDLPMDNELVLAYYERDKSCGYTLAMFSRIKNAWYRDQFAIFSGVTKWARLDDYPSRYVHFYSHGLRQAFNLKLWNKTAKLATPVLTEIMQKFRKTEETDEYDNQPFVLTNFITYLKNEGYEVENIELDDSDDIVIFG
jgi:hypothetical protein